MIQYKDTLKGKFSICTSKQKQYSVVTIALYFCHELEMYLLDMNPHVRLLVCWSVCLSAMPKGREVTLPCFYLGICLFKFHHSWCGHCGWYDGPICDGRDDGRSEMLCGYLNHNDLTVEGLKGMTDLKLTEGNEKVVLLSPSLPSLNSIIWSNEIVTRLLIF